MDLCRVWAAIAPGPASASGPVEGEPLCRWQLGEGDGCSQCLRVTSEEGGHHQDDRECQAARQRGLKRHISITLATLLTCVQSLESEDDLRIFLSWRQALGF